jgi:hypothetical protein
MSKIKLEEGVALDLSGPLRIEKRKTGLYLVGEGTLAPIKDETEGLMLIVNRRNPPFFRVKSREW